MVAHQENSLRKVAILVTTLDESRAKQLLADLPSDIAEQVAQLADDLDDVTIGERNSIADEFRKHMSSSANTLEERQDSLRNEGVELDMSLLEHMESQSPLKSTYNNRTNYSHSDSIQSKPLEQAHIDSIVDQIMKEHPQTMAVILSRLEYDRAAKILGQLPAELQADVLSRIGKIDTPDQETIFAIESQLQDWIDTHRRRQNRMEIGANLVQKILSLSAEQETILGRISEQDPVLAANLTIEKPAKITSQRSVYEGYQEQSRQFTSKQTRKPSVVEYPARRDTKPIEPLITPVGKDLDFDPMVELEKAPTDVLSSCLGRIPERTMMLALVGASESMLHRLLKGLSRRQAHNFRRQLTQFGPIQLSEMITAQTTLLNLVRSHTH